MNEQDKLHDKPSAEDNGTGTEAPEPRDDAGNSDETLADALEAEAEQDGEESAEESGPDEVAELKDRLLRSSRTWRICAGDRKRIARIR